MDKTLAAIYAVDTIGRRPSSRHQSISNRQRARAESKPKRVTILSLVLILWETIITKKETLLKKVM